MLAPVDVNLETFRRLGRRGWKVFAIFVLAGAIVTALTVRRLEPQIYKPTIRVALPGATERSQPNQRPAFCGNILGLRSDTDILPMFELIRYSESAQKHRRSKLKVRQYFVTEQGWLVFRVDSAIEGVQDPELLAMIRDLNVQRQLLLQDMEKRIAGAEQKAADLNAGVEWTSHQGGKEAASLTDYLREQQACNQFELAFLRRRLQASQNMIALDALDYAPMPPSRMKTLIVCLIATLIVASLASMLVGYVGLLRERGSDGGDN